MPNRIDITGQRFGRLVALSYDHTNSSKKAVWKCLCDCGNYHYVTAKDLRSGNTKSCGCSKVERARQMKYKDDRCKDRLYGVWTTMIKRCYNEHCKTYKYYGGRGIVICDEWLKYPNFKNWAYLNGYDESAPKWQCTIDRIDCNGNYTPDNCRWVSMDIQRKNKRLGINPYRDKLTGRYTSK